MLFYLFYDICIWENLFNFNFSDCVYKLVWKGGFFMSINNGIKKFY